MSLCVALGLTSLPQATEDQVKLLMYQQSLEAEFQTNFARLSVTETLYKVRATGKL